MSVSMKETVSIDSIVVDESLQSRSSLNTERIEIMAQALADGAELPPVDLFQVGDKLYLASGFHRFRAHAKAGRTEIDCNVHSGSMADAIAFAAGANKEHDSQGLYRSNADKRRAVEMMLKAWSGWSNVKIAGHVGVSHPFVGKLRPLETVSSQPAPRTGKDGRTINTSNIGKTKPAKAQAQAESAKVPADPSDPLAVAKAEASELRKIQVQISQIKKRLLELAATNAGRFLPRQDIEADAKNLWNDIDVALPSRLCPYCNGAGGACEICHGSLSSGGGWVPEAIYKRAPKEKKVA